MGTGDPTSFRRRWLRPGRWWAGCACDHRAGVWHYDASCTEQFINGGFEANTGWLIKSNPVLAGYVTTPVHRGSRSMRTGIAAGGANKLSYSPIEQAVTFPAGLASATLSFWRYNVNGDAAGWQPNPRCYRAPRRSSRGHPGRGLLLRAGHSAQRNDRLPLHRDGQRAVMAL
ncbi:MAG: hypothetical protein HZY76_11580 [Anaerolineae bacterium]|nr:MAG: hypothetical protein HZY76_11580 [Anaerolineae bacterium]